MPLTSTSGFLSAIASMIQFSCFLQPQGITKFVFTNSNVFFMIVSCTATITCSTVTLLTSCSALTCRLAEHAVRTVNTITTTFLKQFQFIFQLIFFFT